MTSSRAATTAHRFLARFALIALGLYHLPLFLNNYPHLGGGGSPAGGLAVSWGRVFTPVGTWVAQYVLNVASPSPQGLRGDNGDYAEEFGRLLLSIVIAAVGGVAWTLVDRKHPRGQWVDATLHLLLRYSIMLGLAGYAVAKIVPQQFPPLTAVSLEGRIGEQSSAGLLWTFMQYSRPYSIMGGVMELVAILLLFFRRTTTLGAMVCLAVMINVTALNYMYGVPVKLYSTMIVLSAAILVLYDVPRLFSLFVRNEPAALATHTVPLLHRMPTTVRWPVKIVLVGSVFVSSVVVMSLFRNSNVVPASGVDGGWEVTSFSRDGQSLDSTYHSARWRRFAADGYSVAIRLESDSLLLCQRTTPLDSNVLKFSCRGNRQGQVRWMRTGSALKLEGTFDSTQVAASARSIQRSDYRLWRSKFRLMVDRQ